MIDVTTSFATPLDEVIPDDAGNLALTPAVLGNLAYVALGIGLQSATGVVMTGCTLAQPATANLLIVDGSTSLFQQGSATLRLYLFEVANLLGPTERHALLLVNGMPANLTASLLLEQFCAPSSAGGLPAELQCLSALQFDSNSPYLLFSTLDYGSSAYVAPPFPPEDDQLPAALASFVALVKPDLSAGFVFAAAASLQATLTLPPPPGAPAGTDPLSIDIATLLSVLDLGQLCSTAVTVNARLKLSGGVPALSLLHQFLNVRAPASIPFNLRLTQAGVVIYLGTGAIGIPRLELDGTLSLAATPSAVSLVYSLQQNELTGSFSSLPDFADLAAHFDSGGGLAGILGTFLPPDALADLGSIEIVTLSIGIDCSGPNVSTLAASFITAHPLALFDGISLQPALIARFTDPFTDYYTAQVDVAGKWLMKSSELDTILSIEQGPTDEQDALTFFGQLSLGSGVDFLEVVEELFHAQVSGLPTLVLTDLEVAAERHGKGATAIESMALSMDVAAGWTLDGVAIALDDVSLNVAFAKPSPTASWTLSEAGAQGTLQIGSLFFSVTAQYDDAEKSWTFTGGTVPDEVISMGDLLTDLAQALALAEPSDFLAPFNAVQVTSCYLQYRTGTGSSSTWQITVATDFKSGQGFNSIVLDDIVLNFSRDGTGTSFSFDATTPANAGQGLGTMLEYVSAQLGVAVLVPSCLTDNGIVLKGLSASYNAATENVGFVCYLNFAANALVQLHIDVFAQTLNGVTTRDYDLGGSLIFNPGGADEFEFDLDLVKSGAQCDLVASLHSSASSGIKLSSLVHAIAPDAPGLDEFEIDIKDALFAHSGATAGAPARSLFAVDMGAAVNLSRLDGLPLIGHELGSLGSCELAFQVVYATGAYTKDELAGINQMLGTTSFNFPAQDVPANSVAIATSMRAGDQVLVNLTVPVAADGQGNLSPTGGGLTSTGSGASTTGGNDGITWIALNKAFGPLHLNRVGLAFDATNTAISGHLDGGVTAGPLTFDLLGLEVSVPLRGVEKFVPSFGLQGMGLNYQNGPVDIGGALLKQTTAGLTSFDGFVTISTESLEIGAVGSFAQMQDGAKSLFVYAVLGEPLGGPAFFFVTGLAAGFGYNRALLPPAIGDVQNFPLISEAMAPAPQPPAGDASGVRDYIAQKLALMEQDIVPAQGEFFLAFGVKFTSFKLIEGFLLAVVQFGKEFRVDLLGLANASLPPDDDTDPVAEAQLAILAHYIPSEGSIWVQGQLTANSFILSRNCLLTGGFALACWVSGEHSGEFVVSIGGYAPGYIVPAYYPAPPRVGFNWQVSDDLNVKGGGYFALVPHALMAGGALNATWNSGPVSAWFDIGYDFLIEWKPFHYAADIYVDLGAELTIHFFGTHHVSIDASADLQLWGPEFGGHAAVTVSVIGIHFHFSIDFGASASTPPPLKWEQFSTSFLPANDEEWLGVNIAGGLIRTVTGTLADGSQVEVWIVKRDQLNVTTSSALPVATAAFSLDGAPAAAPAIGPAIPGIAPMGVGTIATSHHGISIAKVTGGGMSPNPGAPSEQLKLVATAKKVPSAMWGHTRERPLNPAPGEDVVDSVCGFSIVPALESTDDPAAITVERSSLAYETTQTSGYRWSPSTGTFDGSASSWDAVATTIASTRPARSAALASMGFGDFKEYFNQPLERDAPITAQLGTWGS